MRDVSFSRAISFAQELIRIPSLPGSEGDHAARVRQELVTLEFDDVSVDEAGNVIGVIRGRAEAPPLMLSCHLDAVDVGDPSRWEHAPFSGDIDGGFLHGRGAMDIKGPLALQTYAASSFLNDPPAGDLIIAHTVLEERGGLGMAHLMTSRPTHPGAVIIGEATAGDICIGHRGRAELVVEIEGVAGHASAPMRAHNPLDLLPLVLPAIQTFAAALEEDPVLGRSTLAPTAIETRPRSRNVIPDRVLVILDWRVLPAMTVEGVVERLREHLDRTAPAPPPYRITVRYAEEEQTTYTGWKRTRPLFTPGFLIPADHAIATAAAAAVATATGRTPAIRPWTFATDGGYTCGVHGIPTIGFGPGEERHAHTNRERLDLSHARTVFEAYPEVIRAVQRAVTSAF